MRQIETPRPPGFSSRITSAIGGPNVPVIRPVFYAPVSLLKKGMISRFVYLFKTFFMVLSFVGKTFGILGNYFQ